MEQPELQSRKPVEITQNDHLSVHSFGRISTTGLLHLAERTIGPGDFVQSAFASAVQRPYNALNQASGDLIGTMKLVEEKHDSLSAEVGHLVGNIGSYFLLAKLTNGTVRHHLGKYADSALGAAIEAGVTGGIYGGLLTPSDNDAPLFETRCKQALLGASTFATMGGIGRGLEKTKAAVHGISGKMTCEAIGGGAGGIIEANLKAGIEHKRFATMDEMTETGMTYAAFGAGLVVLGSTVDKFKGMASQPAKPIPETMPAPQARASATPEPISLLPVPAVPSVRTSCDAERNLLPALISKEASRRKIMVVERSHVPSDVLFAQYLEGATQSPFLKEFDIHKEFPNLIQRDSQTCVAIIGGGIGGLAVREELAMHKIPSVLIEGHRIAAKTTGMMGAMVTRVPDQDYAPIRDMYDEAQFAKYINMLSSGQRAVMKLAARLDCDLRYCNSYNISYKPNDPNIVERFRLVHPYDRRVHLARGEQISSVFEPAQTALVLRGEGNLNIRKLTMNMAKERRMENQIYEDSPVRALSFLDNNKIAVITDQGRVTADHVIFATGSASRPFAHLDKYLEPVQCFAVTAKVKDGGPKGNFFDNMEPDFNYFRMLGPKKVMFGGGARFLNSQSSMETSPKVAENLERLFPGARIDQEWTGTIFSTLKDGLPILEQHPTASQVWQLTGLGGIGLVNSAMAAKVFRQTLQGRLDGNPLSSARLASH